MLVFLFLAQHVLALGESCTLANNRLDPSTHKFHSDCEPTEYCASSANRAPWLATPSSAALAPVATTYDDPPITDLFRRDTATTCQPRGCRSDEDPFGYDVTVTPLPPKCGIDEFCPDEGSTCQDLVLLGGACQFDRDDQCVPPPRGANSGDAICLNYVCLWANGTAGLACKIENTVYTGYGPDGSTEYSDIVTRSTCLTPAFYCSPQSLVCVPTQPLGALCAADVECGSGSCSTAGLCIPSEDLPLIVPAWAYVLSTFGLLAILGGTITGLCYLHLRERRERQAQRLQVAEEQERYRAAIEELGVAALEASSMAVTRSSPSGSSEVESLVSGYSHGTFYTYEASGLSVKSGGGGGLVQRRSPSQRD